MRAEARNSGAGDKSSVTPSARASPPQHAKSPRQRFVGSQSTPMPARGRTEGAILHKKEARQQDSLSVFIWEPPSPHPLRLPLLSQALPALSIVLCNAQQGRNTARRRCHYRRPAPSIPGRFLRSISGPYKRAEAGGRGPARRGGA